VNIPIGLAGILIGSQLLREQKREGQVPLDWVGALCSVVGFGAVLYGFSNASSKGWSSFEVLFSLGVGIVFLLAFAFLQLRQKDEGLVDLRLFRKRTFIIANILGWITVVGFFGAEFLLPLYLQTLRGLSPLETGLLLLPLALSSGFLIPFVGKLQDKLGPRLLVTFGFLLLIVNTWQLSDLKLDTEYWYIILLLILRGVALAFVIQATQLAALSVVEPRGLPRASALVNASRSIFQSLGVALLATILQTTTSDTMTNFHPTALGPQAGTQAKQAFANAFLGGLTNAYLLTFWIAAAAAVVALFLPGWPFSKKTAVANPPRIPEASINSIE
jgi:DHA2 family multidrug resistance protein